MNSSKRFLVGLGYVLLILGFLLVVAGVTIYLDGPSSHGRGSVVLYHEECNSGCWIRGGRFTYRGFWMNRTGFLSVAILSFSLDARLSFNGTVNVRLMNSSLFQLWSANRSLRGGLDYGKVKQLTLHFVPTYNDTFYLVMDNSDDAHDKGMSYSYSSVASITLYDFSKPFFASHVAAAGIVLIGIATMFENPLIRAFKLLFFRFRLLLGAGSIYSLKENTHSATFSARCICALLLCETVVWLVSFALLYSFAMKNAGFATAPILFRDLALDLVIRVSLFVAVFLLVPAGLYLLSQLISDSSQIMIRRRLKLSESSRLSLLQRKYFYRSWLYPDSLLGLAVGCGILIVALRAALTGITDMNLLGALVLVALSILSLLWGRNGYLSIDQACRQLHLDFASTFRTDRLLSSVGLSFYVFQAILFLLGLAVGLKWALNYAVAVLFNTSYLAAEEIYKNLAAGLAAGILSALNYFNSNYLLYLGSFFALTGIIYAYVVPNIFTRSRRRKFTRGFGPGIAVFLISYLSQIALSTLLPQVPAGNSYLAIATSVLLAAVTQFLAATYSEVLSRKVRDTS